MKERDIKNEIIAEVNGYKIIRSEAKKYDSFNGEYSGSTKVYYDVCDDEDLLESFKTLAEAKRWCNNN